MLGLYRSLLRKGRQLTLTDKEFYYRRIQQEFKQNQHLESLEEKSRQFEVFAVKWYNCTIYFVCWTHWNCNRNQHEEI